MDNLLDGGEGLFWGDMWTAHPDDHSPIFQKEEHRLACNPSTDIPINRVAFTNLNFQMPN